MGLTQNKVAVVMGSKSDWEQMKPACDLLGEFGIHYTKAVVSAHRMPDQMFAFAEQAAANGYAAIIAGAGGAAHLPGMISAKTNVPVIGVPMKSSTLNGVDSLLSIVQMPGGVPVATMAIGSAGAKNAAIFAARIIGLHDEQVAKRLIDFCQEQSQAAIEMSEQLND